MKTFRKKRRLTTQKATLLQIENTLWSRRPAFFGLLLSVTIWLLRPHNPYRATRISIWLLNRRLPRLGRIAIERSVKNNSRPNSVLLLGLLNFSENDIRGGIKRIEFARMLVDTDDELISLMSSPNLAPFAQKARQSYLDQALPSVDWQQKHILTLLFSGTDAEAKIQEGLVVRPFEHNFPDEVTELPPMQTEAVAEAFAGSLDAYILAGLNAYSSGQYLTSKKNFQIAQALAGSRFELRQILSESLFSEPLQTARQLYDLTVSDDPDNETQAYFAPIFTDAENDDFQADYFGTHFVDTNYSFYPLQNFKYGTDLFLPFDDIALDHLASDYLAIDSLSQPNSDFLSEFETKELPPQNAAALPSSSLADANLFQYLGGVTSVDALSSRQTLSQLLSSPEWTNSEYKILFLKIANNVPLSSLSSVLESIDDSLILSADQDVALQCIKDGIACKNTGQSNSIDKDIEIEIHTKAYDLARSVQAELKASNQGKPLMGQTRLLADIRMSYYHTRSSLYHILEALKKKKTLVIVNDSQSFRHEYIGRELKELGLDVKRFYVTLRGDSNTEVTHSPHITRLNETYLASQPDQALKNKTINWRHKDNLMVFCGARIGSNYWPGFECIIDDLRRVNAIVATTHEDVANFLSGEGIEVELITDPVVTSPQNHGLVALKRQLNMIKAKMEFAAKGRQRYLIEAYNKLGVSRGETLVDDVVSQSVLDQLLNHPSPNLIYLKHEISVDVLHKLMAKHRIGCSMVYPASSSISYSGIDASHSFGVPTYSFTTHTVAAHARSIGEWGSDYILLYGQQGYDAFREMGFSESQLKIVGNPVLDKTKQVDPKSIRTKFITKHDLPDNANVILIATSRVDRNEDIWISEVCNTAAEFDDTYVCIRPHPSFDQSEYRLNLEPFAVDKVFFDKTGDSYEVVLACDRVITDYSTVGVEALAADKPLMTVNLTETPYPSNRYEVLNVALHASTFEELKPTVQAFLKLAPPSISFADYYPDAVKQYNGKNDGRSARRIVDMASTIIGEAR